MSDTTIQQEATAAPEAPKLTRGDLHKSFWRYFWSFQISWSYERMQALGFAWAMQPVLRKLYPDPRSTPKHSSVTWCSSTPRRSWAAR